MSSGISLFRGPVLPGCANCYVSYLCSVSSGPGRHTVKRSGEFAGGDASILLASLVIKNMYSVTARSTLPDS